MKAISIVIFLLLFFGCVAETKTASDEELSDVEIKGESMKITSPAFDHGKKIPKKYTCDGEDLSPPLLIERVPEGTKSLALIVDDPDAPMGTWVHWVVWNIPPDTKEIAEGASFENMGTNDFGKTVYGGPCPPPGPSHTYRFKLYALNRMLDLAKGATKSELEAAMEGHILAEAELDGEYQRG